MLFLFPIIFEFHFDREAVCFIFILFQLEIVFQMADVSFLQYFEFETKNIFRR